MSGDTFEFGGEIAWRPTAETVARSRLTAFMRRHGIADLAALLDRSVADPDWFWPAVFDDLGIEFYEPFTQVLDVSRGPGLGALVRGRSAQHRPQLPRQVGGHRHRCAARPSAGRVKKAPCSTLTYAELRAATNRCANALRELGVRKGDRVALFLPMGPELAAAFFAVVKIGAVVLPLFSGYGADAVAVASPGRGGVGRSSPPTDSGAAGSGSR